MTRRRAEWAEMQKRRGHFEGFEALHLYDEDGSDECHAFLEQSLADLELAIAKTFFRNRIDRGIE